MIIVDVPWIEEVNGYATSAARSAAKCTGIEMDDIHSELWVWIFQHVDKVNTLLEEEQQQALRYYLRARARQWAYREKAKVTGYHPDDVHFYSRKSLVSLLPDSYEYESWGISGHSGDGQPRAKQDPRFSTDRLTMLVDVKSARCDLPLAEQELLAWKYAHGYDSETIGSMLEISPDAAEKRVERAVGKLQKALGGPDPDRQYTGARKAISNAQARAQVDQ